MKIFYFLSLFCLLTGTTISAQTPAVSIYFDHNSTEVYEGAKEMIGILAADLAKVGNTSVEIVGFTNSIGGYDYNHRLSKKRAAAVEEVLRQFNIPIVEINARGELQESGDCCKCDVNENRRVDLIVHSTETVHFSSE